MTAKLIRQAGPSGVPRRPRRGRNTRRQILDASLRLFSERGFARTTVRDIARQAGITDAAIYYHFASKRDLLEALFEEKGIVPALQELERVSTELSPRQTLIGIAHGAMSLMESSREFLRLVFMEALGSEPGAVEEYRSVMERWEKGLARLLTAYMEDGQLRRVDAEIAARQMVTLVFVAFLDDLLGRFGPCESEGGELSPALESYLAASLDNILSGILEPPPSSGG
ncbi:MAG: TetR/AcrR family transcriptional regulator [Chloroflexota bacterium]|nr:TetR/AcrR family transcriptional regulator [Chloroflexota bacterium]